MSNKDYIHDTITGSENQTVTGLGSTHGVAIDNFSSSELSYTPNNDNITRKIPANSARCLLFSVPFSQVSIVANGYYEVHFFD